MTNIYLHGELRNKFGSEFKLEISSLKEAFLAINANRKGFLNEIKKLALNSVHYRVIVDDYVIQHPKEAEIKKVPKEIHIVPIIWGSGTETIAALASMLEAYMAAETAYLVATATVYIIAAVAIAGAMMILFPDSKPDFNQEVQAGSKSYLFGNKPNNTSQGQAVPVGYGRLLIGGSQISAGVSHHSMNLNIKELMTPVDKPIDDFTSLEFDNESPDSTDGLLESSFSTNQTAQAEDSISFTSATIVNSYIDIVSKNAHKITSGPVEVVVRRNGEVVSDINLETYDEDVEYEWSLLENPVSRRGNIVPSIKIEKPYAFQNGLVYRIYTPADFRLTTDYANVASTGAGYFFDYSSGDLVKYGQTQFTRIVKGDWDASNRYYSGQIVKYQTGAVSDAFFQTFVTGTGGPILGFDSLDTGTLTNPTGSDGLVRSQYWTRVFSPVHEYIFKAVRSVRGELPSEDGITSNSTYWTGLYFINNKNDFDGLLSGMPSYKFEGIYDGFMEAANQQRVLGGGGNPDNYAMEFIGYLYVPLIEDLKKQVPDTSANVMYEILRIGGTGQWSGIGLTGANGSGIPAARGVTFTRNSALSTGDGVCYPVVKYKFKIDSDDAADLYIDGQLASTWYGDHGMINPTTPSQIASLPSTSNEILLTAGYHHIYARFQDKMGSDGISIYYQRDSNWDGSYSDFIRIPTEALKHRQTTDLNWPQDEKFMSKSWPLAVSNMVSGRQYKILNLGNTTNWGSFGASSARVGSVFTKTNNTPANGTGLVFYDLFNYAESKSSEANRVVQFSAERPLVNGAYSNGYASFSANYECKVTLDGVTLQTAPVRVKMKMLETKLSFRDLRPSVLPIGNYIV